MEFRALGSSLANILISSLSKNACFWSLALRFQGQKRLDEYLVVL